MTSQTYYQCVKRCITCIAFRNETNLLHVVRRILLRLAESGVNPLECKGNYSAISKNVKLAHDCPCYIWYSKDGPGRAGPQPAQAPYSLYQINVTAYPSTIEVVYNGALVCDFNVSIKGLKATSIQMTSYRRGRHQAVNFSRHAVSVCVSVCHVRGLCQNK